MTRTLAQDGPLTRPLRIVLTTLLTLVPLLSASVLTAAPARAVAAASTTMDTGHGFPSWYEDASGTRVEACLDPNDPNCVLAGFTPTGPVSFPTNFPDEFFYTIADSDRIAVNGCSGTRRGTATIRLALEGTFLNAVPSATDRMVFGRIRIRVTSGLCRNTTYQFVHPFGTTTLTTDADGAIPANVGTVDVGCTPTATVPCDFGLATTSPIFGSAGTPGSGFLRWDPAVAPTAPAGYLGDAVTPHRIVGGTGANEFRILTASGGQVGNGLATNLFTVSGKVAGDLAAAPSLADFGGQPLGSTGSATVTVTNIAATTVTLGAPATSGSAEFAVAGGTCASGTALVRDASCTVQLSFSPTGATGSRSGTLTVPSTGGVRSPLAVALRGTAIEPTDLPGIAVSDASVAFGNVRVGETSAVRTVTVTNTGTAPLQVTEAVLDPAASEQSANFRLIGNACVGEFVAAGATCAIDLQFAPLANGDHATKLLLASNAGPASVDLTGTGTGGTAAVGPVGAYGFPEWYLDDTGIRLGQCIDPDDPNCVVLADPFYDPAQPLVFPDNFPSEYFYYMVDGLADAKDATCNAAQGSAGIRIALEAAFANEDPVDGDQMTFGRIRFKSTGGLCPDTDYLFVSPYGADLYRTDGTGVLKPSPGTQDVGCAPTPGVPCDFAEALSSRVLAGFVRWDSGAPAGYLGDGVTPHAVTGAPYSHDGVNPANYFAVIRADSGLEVAHTDQLAVMGRLQGPLEATPSALAFGAVLQGDSSPAQQFTLANTGVDPITIAALAVTGDTVADFAVDPGTCAGAVLQPTDSCTGSATFSPTATGTRRARVEVTHDGLNNPLHVPMEGVGSTPNATFNAVPASVDLGAVHVGGSSQVETVTISNVGGNTALDITDVQLGGADAAEFALTENRCTAPVAPDATCQVDVAFRPTSAGAKTASIDVTDNADGSPHSVALSASAAAADASVSALLDPGNGFPTHYMDGTGTRVAACLDPNDPMCVLAGFTPAEPVSFPAVFPDEFFYSLADSDSVSVAPIAGCTTDPGTADLRVALEGSFVNGTPLTGEQITFGRVRITASGLCPGTEYTFVTPYGPVAITAGADGAIDAKPGTTDVGAGDPFAGALAAPIAGGFPRWNPNVAPAAPAGYLGDPRVLHTIVGGTYVPAGAAGAFNGFEVRTTSGDLLGGTDKFMVSGKSASGLVGDTAALDLGHVDVNTQGPAQVITVTNVGPDTLVTAIAIAGAEADQFALGTGTCTVGASLATDASCTVSAALAPTSGGAKSAALRVSAASGAGLAVALTGIGNEVGAPIASVTPTSLDFGAQPVGSTAPTQAITVSNTGNADLTMGAVGISGPAAGDYTRTTTCTGTLVPGASCTISVALTPSAAGVRSATLSFTHDAAGSPSTVSLTGTGVASSFSVTPNSVKFGKVAVNSTKTGSVTVKNTGSIPFTPTSAEVSGAQASAFTVQPSATCLGVSLAPGRSCTVSIVFRPTARTTYAATLTVVGDASSVPASVSVGMGGTGR